jgi:ABC-type transporter Mla subunit MlaD
MADQIVAQYILETEKTRKALDEVIVRLEKVESEGKKAANSTKKEFENMSTSVIGGLKNIAAAAGIAFGAQQVISLGKEMVTLAAQAEGVERAFKRVGSPQLLEGLRKATRGTVSDLQLMQNAVKASNFKIPLENLASLFKFAQARARETGESVDYLVDSIILGIGRKSPLILDNLGISAVELRSRLKGVGVEAANVGEIAQIIGDIAEDELAKMGEQADTTADKIAQIQVAFENFKIEIGKDIITGLNEFNEELETTGILLGQQDLSVFSIAVGAIKNALEAVLEPFREFNNVAQKSISAWRYFLEAVGLSKPLYEELIDNLKQTTDNTASMSDAIGGAWASLKNLNGESEASVISIKSLNDEIKALKTQFEETQIGSKEWIDLIGKAELKTQELAKALLKAQARLVMFKQSQRGFDPFAPDEDTPPEFLDDIKSDLDEAAKIIEQRQIDASALVFGTEGSDKIQADLDRALNDALAKYEEFNKKREESTKLTEDEIGSLIATTFSTIAQLSSTVSEIIQNNYQTELQALETQLEKGQITRERYETEKANLQRKAAADEKSARLFSAILNTAAAVTAALNTQPFLPLGPVMAAIAAASGAAQIAVIASQPLPSFAEGGFVGADGQLHGRKHSGGGIKIEAEGGEFITAAKYAQPNRDVLKAINTGNWERFKAENIIAPAIQEVLKGGFEGLAGSYQLNSIFNDKNILKTLDRNRQAERDGFVYLANELKGYLKPSKRGGYAS